MVTSSTSAAAAAKDKDTTTTTTAAKDKDDTTTSRSTSSRTTKADKDNEETDLGIAEPENPQLPYTVEDSDGVERIVTVGDRAWTPPPSDPDPELVKAAKEREKKAKELAKKRQTPLGERKDEDKG